MADVGLLDQVTQEFLNALTRDASIIREVAKNLFFYLVLIQLSLSAIWMTIAGESLQRFMTRFVQLAFSFGFFYALIQFGGQWIPQILNGFIEIGQKAGVHSLDPSSILGQGLSISGAILKGFGNWGLLGHPFVSLVGAVVCIGVIVMYALIAADLTIVLVKAYIIIATGGLFFAFGASDYTQMMAKRYFQTAIGLGLHLMTLYLLLGVGQSLGNQWASMTAQASAQHQLMPMFVILAAVIVYYLIIKNIPPFIAGISGVGGFRNYGDAAVGMAINAGTTGASSLLQTSRIAGRGAQGFTELGKAAIQAHQGFKQLGGMNNFKDASGAMANHIMSSTANTVKNMATRQNQNMTFGQKFNHHLVNKVKNMSTSSGEN